MNFSWQAEGFCWRSLTSVSLTHIQHPNNTGAHTAPISLRFLSFCLFFFFNHTRAFSAQRGMTNQNYGSPSGGDISESSEAPGKILTLTCSAITFPTMLREYFFFRVRGKALIQLESSEVVDCLFSQPQLLPASVWISNCNQGDNAVWTWVQPKGLCCNLVWHRWPCSI